MRDIQYRGYFIREEKDPSYGSCYRVYDSRGNQLKTAMIVCRGSRTRLKKYIDKVIKDSKEH